jgi:hypothetical protein
VSDVIAAEPVLLAVEQEPPYDDEDPAKLSEDMELTTNHPKG